MEQKIKYVDDYSFSQASFDCRELHKTESIMCLGNGYMGLRSCEEEEYAGQSRGLFVAGTFNKADEEEVTELPNCADMAGTVIELDGEIFHLLEGSAKDYEKSLDIRSGLLMRRLEWNRKAQKYDLLFQRFVSQKRLHYIGQKIEICPKQDTKVKIVIGIDGQMTNSGSQHFTDGEKRVWEKKLLQMRQKTTQSHIQFVYTMGIDLWVDGERHAPEWEILIDKRRIRTAFTIHLKAFQRLRIEKAMDVRTDRDAEHEGADCEEICRIAREEIKAGMDSGFDFLLKESAETFENKLWSNTPVKIGSTNSMDELALHFAQYHLHIMTPAQDARMNIGAKGLSGEGYKGHTFWDTEIFALPYFILSNPQTAEKLVRYRYLTLPGARKKAAENGYEGAQFPWESAWLDDGEVTPVWGPADAVTGLSARIESGFIEQHISADVAFGVWQYYEASGDEQFMLDYGYELIFDTARFWTSRLEWNEKDGMYHITDVMGPDEFKEHVDDNAFTNYMAWWNLKTAASCCEKLQKQDKKTYERLNGKWNLEALLRKYKEMAESLYLPQPREDGVLPQDRTYLSLDSINLRKYKEGGYGQIYKDYSPEQISHIQVSKQADALLLFFLMGELFKPEVRDASFDYYEQKTIHDSSLSFSTHAILSCDRGNKEAAYSFFQRACNVDFGQNMHSCDDGVHAAAMAGIWQSAVFGFAGLRMENGKLKIAPSLPDAWQYMEFTVYWKFQKLEIFIDSEKIVIKNRKNSIPFELFIFDKRIHFDGKGRAEEFVEAI